MCRTRLFTRADLDKDSQTGSSGAMEGPEPRRENPVLFHKHLEEKKNGLTTKESLCLRLFQLRVLARTDPLRAQVRWKERKRETELYLVNNFHESLWEKNVCNLALFVLH